MTRDDIIRMAREAGDDVEHTLPSDMEFLERFAALVAAAERAACARLCEDDDHELEVGRYCAVGIRERGDT